jgi:hypothetical protein
VIARVRIERGVIEKVALSADPPEVEFELSDNERIVWFEIHQRPLMKGRSTVDWTWVASIVVLQLVGSGS